MTSRGLISNLNLRQINLLFSVCYRIACITKASKENKERKAVRSPHRVSKLMLEGLIELECTEESSRLTPVFLKAIFIFILSLES